MSQPTVTEQVLEGYKNGMSDAEIMEIMGYSRKQFERRYSSDLAFADFIDLGRTLAEAWWMRQGRLGVHESKFNTNAWMFILKNRFNWAEKLDTKNGTSAPADLTDIKKNIAELVRKMGGDMKGTTNADIFKLLELKAG